MRFPARCSAATLAGVGLAAAFEPVAVAVAAPVSVAVMTVLAVRSSARSAMLLGCLFGAGFMGTLLIWLWQSLGVGAWLALVLMQAVWFGLGAVAVRAVSTLPAWPLWAAAAWTAVELLRGGWPFGGFPWGRLGVAILDTAWAASLPYLSTTGTSLAVALLATAAAWAWVSNGRRWSTRLAPVAAVLVAGLVPSLVAHDPQPSGTTVLALVQGGVPGAGNDVAGNHREVTRNHVEATEGLAAQVRVGTVAKPDLVVWPENSTAVDPFHDDEAGRGIDAASAAIDAPLLVGAMVDSTPGHVLNQGIVWTPAGEPGPRYSKHHPVPFGEYIPLRGLLGGLSDRFEQIPRDMVAGSGSDPMVVAGTSVANAICFDIAYDDVVPAQVRAGARLAIVQTSNATFTGTAQLDQQFAITRARALETGRSVAVTSTNGVTGVVEADGSVQVRAPVRSTEVVVAEVALYDERTPAVRWGPVISRSALAVALLGLLAVGVRNVVLPRRRRAARPWRSA